MYIILAVMYNKAKTQLDTSMKIKLNLFTFNSHMHAVCPLYWGIKRDSHQLQVSIMTFKAYQTLILERHTCGGMNSNNNSIAD